MTVVVSSVPAVVVTVVFTVVVFVVFIVVLPVVGTSDADFIKMCKTYGTGSYPCPPQGWQRSMRLTER